MRRQEVEDMILAIMKEANQDTYEALKNEPRCYVARPGPRMIHLMETANRYVEMDS